MTALLSIRDLRVAYRRDGAEVVALKGVSLDVLEGERLAIIGESGSGKSTL
ncbi:MAG: ATP-binding cassette domain-containing protein, partial [Mesorhizobium sp.]